MLNFKIKFKVNFERVYFFLAETKSDRLKRPANLLLMEKEVSEGDKNLKMKMYFSESPKKYTNVNNLWKEYGFFGERANELSLNKADLPENTLFYINQGTSSMVKSGDQAVYITNVLIAQILPYANTPDIETYKLKDDEVLLECPLYDKDTAKFNGLETRVALIMVRGDENELFLSYGFDPDNSKQLYSSFKREIPNVLESTSFKKFNEYLLSTDKGDYSTMFYFLPSITDRKEKINQFKSNVQLYPVSVQYDEFSDYNKDKRPFFPQHLESDDSKLRSLARETVVNYMKHIANYSNSNLKRNAKSLILTDKSVAVDELQSDFSARFKKGY